MSTTFAATRAGTARPAAAAPTTTAAAAAPRFDIYASIHKALRFFMGDTLARVGRVDAADEADLAATLAQVDALLDVCTGHVEHENTFLHSAIEARLPAGAARIASDHVEHLESIAGLRAETAALRAAAMPDRMLLALRLYRHLALFVADNFQHMHIEETANNAALWAHYSDAELLAIHERILASISPAEHMATLRWLVPAANPFERALILGGMKADASPEAFLGVLAAVRPHLDTAGWRKLTAALGVPAAT